MSIRLSHSAIDKFKTCPKMYKFHYKDRIREEKLGSALLLGNAIDESLNELLKTKLKNPPEDIRNPLEVFAENMLNFEYNKEVLDVPFSLKVRYSMADYDEDIIDKDSELQLVEFLKEEGYDNTNPFEVMANIIKLVRAYGYAELEEVDQTFYNFASWISLGQKGVMMIEAYEDKLLPEIEEVEAIQVEVSLPNELGDKITGYEDFKAKLTDGKTYVCDNKTSSRKYADDSVRESQQLCIYTEFENLEDGAFFVLNKKVRKVQEKTCLTCGEVTTKTVKKCAGAINPAKPATGKNRCNGEFTIKLICSIDTQIIKDKVTEEQKDLTFECFHGILEDIRSGNFERIPKNDCFHFGRKCPYWERCNGRDEESLEGLVQLPEEEEELEKVDYTKDNIPY